MASFFAVPSAQKKRRNVEPGGPPTKRAALQKGGRSQKQEVRKQPKRQEKDEEISGSESDDDDEGPRPFEDELEDEGSSSDEGGEETAAERRLKLAERYLENIRAEVDESMEVGFNAEDIDRDLIAERLQEDVAESKGRAYRTLAGELDFETATRTSFRNHTHTITSIATCPPYVYTVSKDMYLVKWRVQDPPSEQYPSRAGKKAKKLAPPRRQPERIASARGDRTKKGDHKYQGHTGQILTVAASQDGKFVATGGADNKIVVWNATTLAPLRVFNQHRDSVTSLAFRRGTNQLYSASKDRTIKIWSLDELAYIETLFGHQDEVLNIATLAQEHCVSVGARDRTARFWKVVEETQLVFRGGGGEKKRRSDRPPVLSGSLDCVAMIDEEMFVTGSDNGDLSLWVTHKKKPVHTYSLAHGIDPEMRLDEVSAEKNPDRAPPDPQPRWITALATIPYSDIIVSGSWDGHLRAWRVSADKKKIESLGVIGSMPITTNGTNHIPEAETDVATDISLTIVSASKKDDTPLIRGVVNGISIFERDQSFCVVVAAGKEHRLGRWQRKDGKNAAVVFEVAKVKKTNNLNSSAREPRQETS